MGYWIQTFTGKKIDLLEPSPDDICKEDIAHALSQICRFCGHCDEFYSVAQHSVLVKRIAPPEFAIEALLHDAHEAYLGDVTRPLKLALKGSGMNWESLSLRMDLAISHAFGFDVSPEAERAIKCFDSVALATERRDLMSHKLDGWEFLPPPSEMVIYPLGSRSAERLFLKQLQKLGH